MSFWSFSEPISQQSLILFYSFWHLKFIFNPSFSIHLLSIIILCKQSQFEKKKKKKVQWLFYINWGQLHWKELSLKLRLNLQSVKNTHRHNNPFQPNIFHPVLVCVSKWISNTAAFAQIRLVSMWHSPAVSTPPVLPFVWRLPVCNPLLYWP